MSCASNVNLANPCCAPSRVPTCAPQQNPFATYAPGDALAVVNPQELWDVDAPPASLLPPVPSFAAGLYAQYVAGHPL